MVQASAFVLAAAAALVASPAIAVPLTGDKTTSHGHKQHEKHAGEHHHKHEHKNPSSTLPAVAGTPSATPPAAPAADLTARFIDDVDDPSLEAREPKFSFKKAFKSATGAALKWGPKVAPLLLVRDEDGAVNFVYARDLAPEDLTELEARDFALPVDLSELDARDFASPVDITEIDARSPLPSPEPFGWGDIKRYGRKGINTASHVVNVANNVATAVGAREENPLDGGAELDARSESLAVASDATELEARSESLDVAVDAMELEARSDDASALEDVEARAAAVASRKSTASVGKRPAGASNKPKRRTTSLARKTKNAQRRQQRTKKQLNRLKRQQRKQQQKRRRQQRRLRAASAGKRSGGAKKRVGVRELDMEDEVMALEARSVSIDDLD